jgi:hypothetical protein
MFHDVDCLEDSISLKVNKFEFPQFLKILDTEVLIKFFQEFRVLLNKTEISGTTYVAFDGNKLETLYASLEKRGDNDPLAALELEKIFLTYFSLEEKNGVEEKSEKVDVPELVPIKSFLDEGYGVSFKVEINFNKLMIQLSKGPNFIFEFGSASSKELDSFYTYPVDYNLMEFVTSNIIGEKMCSFYGDVKSHLKENVELAFYRREGNEYSTFANTFFSDDENQKTECLEGLRTKYFDY